MNMKALFATSLLAFGAIALVPAPAAADAPLSCAIRPDVCSFAQTCQPLYGDNPGLLGQTLYYASNEAVIGCHAVHAEASLAIWAALASCSATATYLVGQNCNFVVTNGGGGVSGFGTFYCSAPGPAGPGVVGMTEHYALVMGAIGCVTAAGQVGIVTYVAIESCNATGYYVFGTGPTCLTAV
jgi:hypothetical protein